LVEPSVSQQVDLTIGAGADQFAALLTPDPIELVFGVVGPTGVDLDSVVESLKAQLRSVNYETHVVKLSDAILNYDGERPPFRTSLTR
jgi:cytidine deaminase